MHIRRRYLLAGILAALAAIAIILIIEGPQVKQWQNLLILFLLLAVGYTSGWLIYLTVRRKD